jgi:hypothetical protein
MKVGSGNAECGKKGLRKEGGSGKEKIEVGMRNWEKEE